MRELTKKHHTNIIELTFKGPAKNKANAINALKKLNFINISELIPWREIFYDHDKNNESGIFLAGSRYKMDLTQKQLSELTGIPQRHISEMENGKRVIGKKNAHKLAKALNTDYRMFL